MEPTLAKLWDEAERASAHCDALEHRLNHALEAWDYSQAKAIQSMQSKALCHYVAATNQLAAACKVESTPRLVRVFKH